MGSGRPLSAEAPCLQRLRLELVPPLLFLEAKVGDSLVWLEPCSCLYVLLTIKRLSRSRPLVATRTTLTFLPPCRTRRGKERARKLLRPAREMGKAKQSEWARRVNDLSSRQEALPIKGLRLRRRSYNLVSRAFRSDVRRSSQRRRRSWRSHLRGRRSWPSTSPFESSPSVHPSHVAIQRDLLPVVDNRLASEEVDAGVPPAVVALLVVTIRAQTVGPHRANVEDGAVGVYEFAVSSGPTADLHRGSEGGQRGQS